MNSCVYTGIEWFVQSGIQDEHGGVSSAYRGEYHDFLPITAEGVSYYICSILGSESPEDDDVSPNALAAGRFITQRLFDPSTDLILDRVPWPGAGRALRPEGSNGHPPKRAASFYSCGLAVHALVRLWRSTADHEFLKVAERCGAAMLTRLSRVDGSFFPVYDIAAGEPRPDGGHWSNQAEVHQLKVSLAFHELCEATGGKEFLEAARSLAPWAMRRHEQFLPGADTKEAILDRAHGYCCFLEGLLPFVGIDMNASQALQFGILRIENLINEHAKRYERCDLIAQTLRLRLYADRLGVMELDYPQAESEARRLAEFQMQSLDPHLDGGFAEARRGRIRIPHVSPRVTAIAVQALEMWAQAEDGAFREPWQVLI